MPYLALATNAAQSAVTATRLPAGARFEDLQVTFDIDTFRPDGAAPHYPPNATPFAWWKDGDGEPNPVFVRVSLEIVQTNLRTARADLNTILTAARSCVAIIFRDDVAAPTIDLRIPILGLKEYQAPKMEALGNQRTLELIFGAGHHQFNTANDYSGTWQTL